MARENLMDAIGDIAREKGIDQERLVSVIQEAVTQAAKRKFKQFEDIEARINVDSGELEVFRYKTVAENADDPDNQIPLDEARKMDSLAEPGDEVEYEIDNRELSRVIAQTARQLIFQKIREAERETIYDNFKDRVGEVLNGVVSRTERGRTFVTINQTEAILYRREQIPHERYSNGDHIRLILLDVLNDPKEPSLLVISRAHPELLVKLFEMEVPEVYDGIVEIVDAAREPGRRAKIAVRSHDPDVDPVGACVGLRGSRVQSIIAELRGEKIDIIHYTDDFPTYVANALAPAELSRIKIDEEEGKIDVEVDSDQLSLAIGRYGQNVRLASKLVGYKIDVMSPQEAAPSLEEQIRQSLLASQAQLETGGDSGGEGAAVGEPASEGEATAGETTAAEGAAGETPAAEGAAGETPAAEGAAGDATAGDATAGKAPEGDAVPPGEAGEGAEEGVSVESAESPVLSPESGPASETAPVEETPVDDTTVEATPAETESAEEPSETAVETPVDPTPAEAEPEDATQASQQEPSPAEETGTATEPVHEAASEPVPVPESTPESVPVAAAAPETAPEPEAASEASPEPEAVPEASPEPEAAPGEVVAESEVGAEEDAGKPPEENIAEEKITEENTAEENTAEVKADAEPGEATESLQSTEENTADGEKENAS